MCISEVTLTENSPSLTKFFLTVTEKSEGRPSLNRLPLRVIYCINTVIPTPVQLVVISSSVAAERRIISLQNKNKLTSLLLCVWLRTGK